MEPDVVGIGSAVAATVVAVGAGTVGTSEDDVPVGPGTGARTTFAGVGGSTLLGRSRFGGGVFCSV